MAKKKKSTNKILYYLTGIVIFLIILAMIGKNAGWIGQTKELEVEIADVGTKSIIEKVSASGTVQPVVEVNISPDVPGEIIELNVEEGDSVTQGQLLVRIRPDNFINALERAKANYNQQQANLASAKASLARAHANHTRAEADYKRNKELFEQKVLSEAEWDAADQAYKVANNDLESAKQSVKAAEFILESAKATVGDAEENLRLTNVNAPVYGIVSKLNVEQGERVVGTQQFTGTEMMRIADLNQMEVLVDVNENDIIRVSIGDTVIIDVDAYSHLDKKFKGLVTSIANTANDKVSQDAVTEFEVKIRILNSSYDDLITKGNRFPFRPGMTASVEIITDQKDDILAVPLSAVTTRNKQELERQRLGQNTEDNETVQSTSISPADAELVEIVFVNRDGIAKAIEVKTGISDYENIEILSGLTPGDQIIIGPFLAISRRLKDGDAVKKTEKTAPEPAVATN
jgi:HlyD family secretion protein